MYRGKTFKGLDDINFMSVDTEDDSKGNVKLIVFFDGINYYDFYNKDDVKIFLNKFNTKVKIYACNLEYDIVNLFENFLKDTKLKFGSRLISAKYKKIEFFDVGNHFTISVEKMGKILKLKKLDSKNFNNKILLKYCKRDAEIVFKFMKYIFFLYKKYGIEKIGLTLGSTMMRFWRENFFTNGLRYIDSKILDVWKEAYFGGRVEAKYIGIIEGDIRYIDINSMFPFVMKDNFYPYPFYYREDIDLDKEGVTYCKVESKLETPILPYRKNGKLLFPNGIFSGRWCNNEIRFAISKGVKILKLYNGYVFDFKCTPFIDYVNYFYKLRLKNKKNKFENQFIKRCLNALYGKFGQKDEKIVIESDEDFLKKIKKGIIPENTAHRVIKDVVIYSLGKKYPFHSNVIWSAYVTAYARIKLYNLLEHIKEMGNKILYYDTDGVFILGKRKISISNEIGGWKVEGRYKKMEIRGCKFYRAGNKIMLYKKVKGVPYKNMQEFFDTGKTKYKKPVRIKEGIRRSLKFNLWIDREKKIKSGYEKGIVDKNGSVTPLNIFEKKKLDKK